MADLRKATKAFWFAWISLLAAIGLTVIFSDFHFVFIGAAVFIMVVCTFIILFNARCNKCGQPLMAGTTLLSGVKFCPHCGDSLEKQNQAPL